MSENNFSKMEHAIHEAVKKEIDDIIEAEVENSRKRIESKMKSVADTMALRVMTYYSAKMRQDELVITVHKDYKEEQKK